MLMLTKLDGSTVLINTDSIKYVEANPDTRVHFLNGDSMIIVESLEVIEKNMLKLKAGIVDHAKASRGDKSDLHTLHAGQ